MPYKDKEKQKVAVRKAVQKHYRLSHYTLVRKENRITFLELEISRLNKMVEHLLANH
jgi:hypothetical protein